jgi:acetyl-CoA carboxylase biotin carboxyl carrier protein
MNLDAIKDILELVRQHDLAEFEFEQDGLKLRIRKAGGQVAFVAPTAPVALPAAPAGPTPVAGSATPAGADAAEPADPVDLAVIKSPIVGTFYRSSEPGAKPFAEIGDVVKKGQVLCIIEAMKLMNEIESDCDGQISAIYVENGKAVQFGERLFAVGSASRRPRPPDEDTLCSTKC